MDIRLLFPNKYISAADLIEAMRKTGKDGVALTISRLAVEDLKTNRGTERKPVIHFVEMEKRKREGKGEEKMFVVNKTNAKSIAKMYGTETNNWVGKKIVLFPSQCEAFGEQVDCIRVMVTQDDEAPRGDSPRGPADAPTDVPDGVDPVTGEVTEDASAAPAAPSRRGNGGAPRAASPRPATPPPAAPAAGADIDW